MDTETLAHTKWNCKYHIVFAPKFRRQIVYGNMKTRRGRTVQSKPLRKKGIEIIEATQYYFANGTRQLRTSNPHSRIISMEHVNI